MVEMLKIYSKGFLENVTVVKLPLWRFFTLVRICQRKCQFEKFTYKCRFKDIFGG